MYYFITQMQDIAVTLQVDVLYMPCELIDLRFIAKPGKEQNIRRSIVTATGEAVAFYGDRNMDDIAQSLKKGEGCRVHGTFYKHFVSNAFFISLGNPFIYMAMKNQLPDLKLDFTHRIDYIILGEHSKIDHYKNLYKMDGFNKLGGTVNRDSGDIGVKHTYNLKAINTVFDNTFTSSEVFQYVPSYYGLQSQERAIIFM